MIKLLCGEQPWPRGVHPLVALKTTMRTADDDEYLHELLEMPDEDIFDDANPADIKAEGFRLLDSVKIEAGKRRIAGDRARRQ